MSNLDLLREDREYIIKTWGMEEVLVNNDQYCSKLLHITPGYRCSLHEHSVKHESFFAMVGLIHVEYITNGELYETILSAWRRDGLDLPPFTPHRFWAEPGTGPAVILEVSTPHSDSDVTRLEPSGPLEPTTFIDQRIDSE